MRAAALVAGVAAALMLAGCAGGGARLEAPPPGTQDVNPRDPSTLRDGGDLRIPLDNLPPNYNYNQVDGHENTIQQVMAALMPQVFEDAPDGTQRLNTDVVSAAELVSADPQVVHYRINDRAVWSNGRPIDWQDFAAQVRANNASNQAYLVADKSGYADVAKVDRGATDKDVLVTFAHPYSEWQQLFYMLYPRETNDDPSTFNTGWLLAPRETAGPFRVGAVDRTAQTITLVRNERWWGPKPRLNRIIFTVTERRARADRLANNEIDIYEIGSDVDLFRRAQTIPGVKIRQAIPKQYPHLTFNGAPGSILSDLKLRQAIARGVDRNAVAQRLVGPIVPKLVPMGNHIYPVGSKGYRDNSAFPFDQAAANAELDALGWVRPSPGAVRAKDGKPLRLRLVVPAGNPPSDATSKTLLDQLGQIGVQVVIEAVPANAFFAEYVNRGNFDLTTFQWVSSSASFSNSLNVYQSPQGNDIGNNFSRIWDPRIDQLYRQGFAELDDDKRIQIGNEIDKLIWQEVHNIPLYPQTGAFAVREKLANFGAKGLGDWDYIRAGWMN